MAPFSDKDSYLFNAVPLEKLLDFSCRFILSIVPEHFTLAEPRSPSIFKQVLAVPIQNQSLNDEIQFSTDASDFDFEMGEVECFNPINETVRVWYQNGDDILVWSCRELQIHNVIFHDAALIYAVSAYQYPKNNLMFEEMMKKFQSLASDYFNDTLQDLVKWPEKWPINIDVNVSGYNHNYTSCVKRNLTLKPNPIHNYVFLLVPVLFIAGVLIYVYSSGSK